MDQLSSCVLWDPSFKKIKHPRQLGQYIPLYQVFITRYTPTSYRRGWFWLYECIHCGGERLMSTGHVVTDECTCTVRDTSVVTPKIEVNTVLEKIETPPPLFHKPTKNERELHTITKLEQAPRACKPKKVVKTTTIANFDRSIICMREVNKDYHKCDNFHICKRYRIENEVLGPLFKNDRSCYVFSGRYKL